MKVWSLNDSQCKQSVVHAGTVWQVQLLGVGEGLGRPSVDGIFPKKIIRIIRRIEVKVAG